MVHSDEDCCSKEIGLNIDLIIISHTVKRFENHTDHQASHLFT